ncbi:MAG: ABC transporter ATP-binding protein [Granulosicoccus sp.]
MARLTLDRISKHFGTSVAAVDDVSLTFPSGQITALLGPSGCGKTTLLRIIAGLEQQSSGIVTLSDRDISSMSASQRRFGMVFQSFALFPHLNVEDNVAYSLSIKKVPTTVRRERANELLDLVKLGGYGRRRIGELSGGQRQRVAIARALAQDPSVFLLDEPMSALDAQLREQMQIELKLLQQQLGITTIVVTHDQREAMTMADQIVVLRDGRVEQVGTPHQIYHQPASQFVASFIGQNNILNGVVRNGYVDVADQSLFLDRDIPYRSGAFVHITCRPEFARVVPLDANASVDASARTNQLPAKVTLVRDIGPVREVFLDVNGQQVLCVDSRAERERICTGDQVLAELPGAALTLYPRETAA